VASTPGKPASAEHVVYPPEDDFLHEGGVGCADGDCMEGCCDDPSSMYDPWYCHPRLSWWGSAEYLVWWRKGSILPPLVSTGPLNLPASEVVFGDGRFDFGPQPGGRVTFGAWLDDNECIGLGARFFALSDGRIDFEQTNIAPGALFRPFTGVHTGPNAVDIGGANNGIRGAIDIENRSEVYNTDAIFRKRIECGFAARLDLLAGYQFSRINEDLDIRTTTDVAAGQVNIFDTFDTRNEFHGGTLGLQMELDRGCFSVDFLAKIGLGNMNETVIIQGGGNPPNTGLLGLLAQTSNVGEFEQDDFAVIPEANLNLGYRLTEHIELSVGYSMVYWSQVVRPGEQVDLVIDELPNVAPNPGRPAFAFDTTDFWVMGLNFGCQWSY
jgi:hypothetical protein